MLIFVGFDEGLDERRVALGRLKESLESYCGCCCSYRDRVSF